MRKYISIINRVWLWIFLLAMLCPVTASAQNSYPVHVSVQALPPYGIYLRDYYSGTRDKLIVTLLNRDNQQRTLQVKLRVQIKNGSSFSLRSRDELYYPMLTLESGVPLRLTSADLAAYLAPEKITMQGYLNKGKLPTGMTEFSVQAVDYTTGRTLSEYGTGRVWLEIKQPPTLNLPAKDEQIAYKDPQHIRFQWMPRHQGLANTQYEFVLKQLPDNGAAPQSAFAYGQEIYRTETRFTTLNYTHLEPMLMPGARYGWQVRAIAKDGIDEIGMFDNNGYSEIGWFELNDNCPAVTNVKATGGYRKMTLEWKGTPQQREFFVEYRPKSSQDFYDWTSTRTFDTSFTAYQLNPGWTYEYRVGAICMKDKPVYSPVQEITLSMDNEARMKQCGVAPKIDLSNQTPKEDLKVGDVIIAGSDFPLTITELSSQGNGWYSGKGWITLTWIFEIKVAVKFNRLRVNTDNRQIDGTAETETDPNAAQIKNTNELDYGGSRTTAGKVEFAVKKVEFTVPDTPVAQYDPETEELIVFDTEGKPHVVETKKNEGESIFPMVIEDEQGNKYQIDAPPADDTSTQPGGDGTGSGGSKQQPVISKIEDAPSGFDPSKLATDVDFSVRFLPGNGKYAFDAGKEPWYQTAQLIKEHYRRLENDYIAPWKLIPVGENDVVEAVIAGNGADKKKIKFTLKDGKGVPAREENGKWIITLPAVKSGETYEVFAVYEEKKGKPQTVGKLNVVSYSKQKHTVTLVPVDGATPDTSWLETQLNNIFTPYGVTITVKVDDSLKGDTSWDLDGDGALNLNGSGFFSKETNEMKALRKLYQKTSPKYDRNAYYIFLSQRAKASDEPDAGLAVQGDMPRGKQFGYIFMQNSANTPRLIAHELGHGIFTLLHTFDVNYSGDKFKSATTNLMDYNNGTELAVWQWNVMAKPAPLTWFDSEDDAKSVGTVFLADGQNTGIAPNKVVIRECYSKNENYQIVFSIEEGTGCIHGIHLYDKNNKRLINSYIWNSTKEDYIDKTQKSIKDDNNDIHIVYNLNTDKAIKTVVYRKGNRCYYYSAQIEHLSGYKIIDIPNINSDKWEAHYLFDASDDCKKQLAREEILKSDRAGCADLSAAIKTIKAAVGIKEPEKLVPIINSVCLDALKELSYEQIVGFIRTIAQQKKLKEDSELAIIRLINAINNNQYGEFFKELESKDNELIKYLVDQLDDASAFFWYENNYTNFMGALVSMFKSSQETIAKSWPQDDESAIKRVVNLHPENYQKLADADHVVFSNRVNSGEYNSSTGNITTYEIFTTTNYNIQPNGSVKTQTTERKEKLAELSPLTPVILVLDDSPLSLIETALDGSEQLDKNAYLVPAIFLKYSKDKVKNHKIEVATNVTLDLITIAASGPVAIAANVGKVRRIWAIIEVAGAIGDIGVNSQTIDSDSYLGEAVEAYNLAMGVIGVKNTVQGGYRFIKNLNPEVLNRVKNNQGIRDLLKSSYLKFKSKLSQSKALGDYDNLDNLTKQNISQKETIFDDLLKETKTVYRKFTEQEIDEYVKQATQYPEREKVMLGKYERNSPNSYEQIADKEKCTFFEFKRWNEIYSIVGNDDEMWRINKEFILRQKQLNKEFYFSHDPESSKYATGFYKREIDLLKLPKDQGGLGGTIETIIKGKLWKMKF